MKAATFHLLLDTAMEMIQHDGHVPSVAEVAARSKVSRATAYRYFPSRSALVTAVVDSSLGPVRRFVSSDSRRPGPRARAVREDLPALQGVRAADARRGRSSRSSSGRSSAPACSRRSRTGAATASRILEHALRAARAAAAGPGARPAAPRPLGRLRHRALHRAEGHLGPGRSRGRADRALDGRRPDRRGAARRRPAAAQPRAPARARRPSVADAASARGE